VVLVLAVHSHQLPGKVAQLARRGGAAVDASLTAPAHLAR
jgi:hypothetical protein